MMNSGEDLRMRSEHWKAICQAEAGRLGVCPEIHPEDAVYRFIAAAPEFAADEDGAVRCYFQDGRQSARNLRSLLADVCGYDGSQPIRFLEFDAGHGCVTRHLADVIPFLDVTACGSNSRALRFLCETLGVDSVPSPHRPEDLFVETPFDVVFALSFFSYLPKESYAVWLGRLAAIVKPGGFFIFTACGEGSGKARMNGSSIAKGTSSSTNDEHQQMDAVESGMPAALPHDVLQQFLLKANCRPVYFRERYWWSQRDVHIVRRVMSESPTAPEPIGGLDEKDRRIRRLEKELAAIRGSRAFGVFRFLQNARSRIFPYGSRREQAMFAVLGEANGDRAVPSSESKIHTADIRPGTKARTFHELAAGMTDEAYRMMILASVEQPVISNVKMPGFPSEQIQKNFVGSAREIALQEGFNFYQIVKRYCRKLRVPFGADTRVLDFGCGWGRISRFFFKDISSANFFGVDVDPKMIEFCAAEMTHGRYRVCQSEPPMGFFAGGSLDVIFAYSVFTHLSEAVAGKWIEESARLLRPGGILLATTQRRAFLDYCESLQRENCEHWDHLWHKNLSESFIPIEQARKDYDQGKFLFSGTGGGEFRDKSFYGEALIPRRYIEREYTRFLSLRDFLDDPEQVPQALFVMQK